MIEDKYQIEFSDDFQSYEFDSIGPKGIIRKAIQYTKISSDNYFNLGFGDKNKADNSIDDLVVTDNKDSQKILLTVTATLYVFTNHYPNSSVLVIGSTLARTRLYRIGITNNLERIEQDFWVYGLLNKVWQPFKKGIHYDAFLVRRKVLTS